MISVKGVPLPVEAEIKVALRLSKKYAIPFGQVREFAALARTGWAVEKACQKRKAGVPYSLIISEIRTYFAPPRN